MSRRAAFFALLKRHWPILIPALFVLSVFHAWVTPGLLLGSDWVRRVPDELNNYFPWPHVWNAAQQIGENDDPSISYYPLFALMGLCSVLHVSWSVIERVFFFFPYLIVSVVSPYVFTFRLTRSPIAAAVAASIWTVNSWIIMATERGAIPSLVAASLLPLFFFYALRFIERATIRRGLGLGLLLSLVLLYDLRYVYIAVVFALILAAEQLIRDLSLRRLQDALVPLCVAVVTAIIANLYWIIPQFAEVSNPGAGYGTVADYIQNSGYMTPEHALSAFAVFYHWVASDDPFAVRNPDWYFFFIPVAVFLSLASNWRKRWIPSLAVGAAIAILLDSGPTFPLDGINIWIFQHIPGMMLFRDVTKWFSLLFITYGTIIGFGVARLAAWVRLALARAPRPVYVRWVSGALVIAVVAGYVAIMNDSYNPMRFRVFYPYRMHHDVLDLEAYLQSRPGNARTLVFPRDIEPMRAIDPHPYVEALQIENSASPDGLRHLDLEWDSLYGLFSSPFAPDILREMNIGYVVVPYDYDKVIYSSYISNWTFYDAVQFMKSRPWLRFDRKIGRHYVFRVIKPMLARAFVAPVPFVLNGDGAALAALVGTPLLNAKTSALLPDQTLGAIWERIPNYVGGVWTVDTNLNALPAAREDVRLGEDQATAAQAKHFSFIAAAVSSADRKPNLFSGDFGESLDGTFGLPSAGRAAFSANLSDLAPLNEAMYTTAAFVHHPATVTYDPQEALFDFDSDASVSVETPEHRVPDGYAATLLVENENAVPFQGDLSIPGLKTSIPISATFDGQTVTCPLSCRFQDVALAPGDNRIELRMNSRSDRSLKMTIPATATIANAVPANTQVLVHGTEILDQTIPLEPRPFMDLHYALNANAGRLHIYMLLRSNEDGSQVWFIDDLPHGGTAQEQLQYVIGDAIHERFERLLARQAGDRPWLYTHRLSDEPDGPGEYDIMRVVVAGDIPDPIVPHRLQFLATPSWPQMASNDSRRYFPAQYPQAVVLEAQHGLHITASRPFPGYFAYALRPLPGKTKNSATFTMQLPPSSNRYVDFDIYQPVGYSMSVEFNSKANTLIGAQLLPSQGKAFPTGGIVVNDPDSVEWPTGTPHCVPALCGEGAVRTQPPGWWKRFYLDLSDAEPDWSGAHLLTVTLTAVDRTPPARADFGVATFAGDAAIADRVVPATLLDDVPLRYDRSRGIPELSYTVLTGATTLKPSSEHHVVTVPVYPVRPVSLVVSQGPLRGYGNAVIHDDRRINDEEYIGSIDSRGGLFVFDESYDPDWTLAIVPATFKPSGVALFDWLRTRRDRLPVSSHYKVTDLFNGWWIGTGNLRVFALMQLEAYVQLAAIVWGVLLAAWLVFIAAVIRRRPA